MTRSRIRGLVGPLVAGALAACAPPPPPPPPAPAPLPALPAEIPPPAPIERRPVTSDPLSSRPQGPPVTLTARNVDVRVLLVALAEQAGVSLVLDPAVQGRTTVSFTNLPAMEALRAVLAGANLGVVAGPPAVPIGPVVFYAVPVDVESASAELLQARFRVGPEIARFIAENQLR